MRLLLLLALASSLFAQNTTYRVRGTLTGDGGQPQAAAKVGIALARGSDRGPQRFTLTDTHGVFAFDNLPAGNYRLLSQAKGYLEEDLNQHEGYFSGVIVGPGKDSEHILFPLRRAAAIHGAVSDDANEPVRGASVLLFRRMYLNGELDTREYRQAQTDDRGDYAFHDLPPGEYFIAVSAQPWYAATQMTCPPPRLPPAIASEPIAPITPSPDPETAALDVAYPLTFFGGATDDRDAQPIRLRAGDRFQAEIVLTPVPAAHVRLHTAAPASRQFVNVRLEQTAFDAPLPFATSMSGCGDGVWTVSGVAPGHYTATIHTNTFPVEGGTEREVAQVEMPLDLAGDMQIDPQAHAARAPTVSGIVQLAGKPPRAGGARIYFRSRGQRTVSAMLEANGAFKPVPLLPGRYDVFIFAPGAAPTDSGFYVVEAIAASGGGSTAGHTLVVNGGSVNLALSASNQLGNITGTVLDGDKPVPGAMVLLVPKKDITGDKALIRRDQTDSDGSFSLRSVPYGAYTVLALRHGWEMEWANPAVLQPFLPRGVSVAVDDSGKSNLKVPLQ